MTKRSATLVHVSIIRGGTYHDNASVSHHGAATGVVSDTATTTLLCVPACGQTFLLRMRTGRELWRLRLRRLLQAVGSVAAGAVIAILGGLTELTPIIVITALLSLIAYVAGAVFLLRIFARSARYILTTADGQKVQSTDHKVVLEPSIR